MNEPFSTLSCWNRKPVATNYISNNDYNKWINYYGVSFHVLLINIIEPSQTYIKDHKDSQSMSTLKMLSTFYVSKMVIISHLSYGWELIFYFSNMLSFEQVVQNNKS